jgi:large subunit ribosomal protein L30
MRLQIRQTRSYIGHPGTIRRTLTGLGLGRIGKTNIVANTPSFRGAIKKVLHLVEVQEVK